MLLEAIQGMGFKARGYALLFPARGLKPDWNATDDDRKIRLRFTLPRKGIETNLLNRYCV